MKRKFSDEKSIDLILEYLKQLKRGEINLDYFAVAVALIIDPFPLNEKDMEWAVMTAKSTAEENASPLPVMPQKNRK